MKRFLALLMAMVMIVTLAACGENQKINSTDTSTTTESGIESANDGNIDTTTIKGTDNSKSSTTEDNTENNTSTTSTNSGTQTTDRPSTSSTKPNSTTTAKPNTSTSSNTANSNTANSNTANSNTETTSSTTSSTSKPTTSTSTSTTSTESLYYNVVFKLNGKNLSTNQLKKGEKITVPSAGSNKWYVWDKQVPSTMPSSDLLFNAVAIAGTTWEYNFKGCLTIHGRGRMSNYSENSQPWKEYKSEITAVKFDNTITEIGKYAFFGLKNLTTVVIPNNITIIGSYSFANCNNIQSITFGQNVKYIGTQAFASSSDINTVKFLGTKTWFAKQGNYQTSITFSSYNNASLFSEYKSYAFSHQENWWPNY